MLLKLFLKHGNIILENKKIKFNKYLLSNYWILGARNKKVTGKWFLFLRNSQSHEVYLRGFYRAEETEDHKKDIEFYLNSRGIQRKNSQ